MTRQDTDTRWSKDTMVEARLANLCAQLNVTLPDVIRVAKKLNKINDDPDTLPTSERVPAAETTYCRNDHKRTTQNTGHTKQGHVFCRDCKRARDAESHKRRLNDGIDGAMRRHPAGKKL